MDLDQVTEEWVAGKLASAEANAEELMQALKALVAADRGAEAAAWGEQLFDALAEEKAMELALDALELVAVQRGHMDATKAALKKLLSNDRNALKLIEPAGFDGKTSMTESFSRLRFLMSLKTGMLCYNATWGFGIIEHIDYFYRELEVEFDRKGEHEMSFSYAAEALEVLNEDHILAIKHDHPDDFETMIKKEPGEVVRIALRSYGAMPVTRLQETLSPTIIPEAKWKSFWDGARKALKEDASIEIPKKRSENIILNEAISDYDHVWLAMMLDDERDIEVLFQRFNEVLEKGVDVKGPEAQTVLADRLAFIIKGAPSGRPDWKAQGLIYARTFGIEPAGLEADVLMQELVHGDLVSVFEALPSRQLQILLNILIEGEREETLETLQEVIPVVSHPVLNDVINALISNGAEDTVKDIMGTAVGRRKASAPMLLWCQRQPGYIEKWNLISQGDLAFRIQEVLEVAAAGAMLRAQNQLRDRFSQEEWLHEVMSAMTEQQRRDFLRRLHEGRGWDVLDQKSVLAKILRKFPELQDIILPSKDSAAPKKDIPFTSERSFSAKQAQLEQIVKVDIPENSKEIEVARSHGDLRENAEFKYAKERQGLLMAQAGQLAEDIEKVKPTDFSDSSTDEVMMGTGVELAYADGKSETYYILGVWDQNEELNIVSSETGLAQALMGHVAGDMVAIPSGEVELKAILPLSDEVKAWVKG